MRAVTVAAAGVAWLVVACGTPTPGPAPTFSAQPKPTREMPLSRPPAETARLLERERFEFRDMEPTHGGTTRSEHARAYFPAQGVAIEVKWKVAPSGGEGWNNVPRKELAAFVIQQWFLEARDWVVPPTAIRCVPVEEHRRFEAVAPVVPDTQCVLGTLSAWLHDVKHPDAILDRDRFREDPGYARFRANMNLVAYLIHHRDGRLDNFFVPRDDDVPIYLTDNGISFDGVFWNYFRPNWDVIRVPALPRASVDRLRRLTSDDVSALLVLAQLEADAQGVLQPARREPAWDPSKGARLRSGRAQFGLRAVDVAGVAARLQELLARVDAGEIPVF